MSLLKVSLFSILSALSFATAPQPAYGSAPPQDSYLVRPGDSLWKIASRAQVYGTAWKWPLIYDANQRIIDPELIEVGWNLNVPLAPTQDEIVVAMEQARQYEGRAEVVPPVEGMALADIRVMDDTLPIQAPPKASALADPFAAILVLGAFIFTGLLILAYSFVPLFLAWTRVDEPVLTEDEMEQMRAMSPEEPGTQAATEIQPQPTESEEIVRAMEGKDPPKPTWKVAENGELVKEEEREKMAA
jgi:hypothetical protein